MNILQVLPQLNIGGVETGTLDIARYLIKNGHKCIVASAGGELVRELEASGVKHYQLPLDNKFFGVMFKAADKLADIVRREEIDIIHARSRVPAWVGFMAARKTETMFLTTAHGHYSRHIFSYMMGWGKYTIVPSAVIGKHMMEDFGVPLENLKLIPRSVDLEKYSFKSPAAADNREFRIGVIGRITPIKGQIYFLKALAQVVRSKPSVKAWIVGGVSPGKDNYMEELEVWTRRLGLSSFVEFLGNRRDIPAILSKLDCLVMPSIAEEAFGRVIVEAAASGVPVVATRVGGVVEIIDDNKDGLLVYPKDPEGLAEAILKIIKDPLLAARLAQNAQKKAEEKFSLEKMAGDTIEVYREALSKPRILVIKLSAVGDAILSVPSFEALKKKFPASRIVCLTGAGCQDVFKRCPYVDELIVCDFKGRDKGPGGLWRLAKKLMRRRFDICIDLQNNKKSHILSYVSFSFRRYGYDNAKFALLLNHRIKGARDPLPPVQHQFRVLEMLDVHYDGERPRLWLAEEDESFADALLKESGLADGRLIGVNIGASSRWKSKRWPAARFARLCDELAKRGYRVLLTGGTGDAGFARTVLKDVKAQVICSVAQTDLTQLAALIRKCDAYVTGDSAPLHVAGAMQVPFVALFGPTDPDRHMPPADRFVVLDKECPSGSGPCYKDTCKKFNNACMKNIKVEDVVDAVESLLR